MTFATTQREFVQPVFVNCLWQASKKIFTGTKLFFHVNTSTEILL